MLSTSVGSLFLLFHLPVAKKNKWKGKMLVMELSMMEFSRSKMFLASSPAYIRTLCYNIVMLWNRICFAQILIF